MINVGIVGYGYWGPNVLRNFVMTPQVRVIAVCDQDRSALAMLSRYYHGMRTCRDYREITKAKDIDAVAIVTPVSTHFAIARSALTNGKHVFIEKPLACSSREAEELIRVAERKRLTLMVDHTFLFTGAVRKIKEIIDRGELGTLKYYDSTRVNLGLFQKDVNVIWDLAPHDFSILDYLIDSKAVAVSASGFDHFGTRRENIAYLTVYLQNNLIAHFNLNWISPVKIRSTLIGGHKKMLLWNDLEPDEKIKVYDTRVNVKNKGSIYKLLVSYRAGDMWSPKVDQSEALKLEAEYFAKCILSNKTPINDGYAGLRVVKFLEASGRSLRNESKQVKL